MFGFSKPKQSIRGKLALLASASALILAACGGDDSSSQRAEPAEPQETAAPAMPADDAEMMADDMEAEAEEMADDAEDMADDMADAGDDMMDDADEAMSDDEPMDTAMAGDMEATGTVHEIQMLNADPDNPRERMVFRPDLVVAKPGDTIRFVPTDPSHQSSSIDGMIPDGTDGWRGDINKAVEYVVPQPGVYGYKCVPHYAAGMVGLLIVEGDGMMDNVDEAKGESHVGLAARRFDDIWSRAEEQYLSDDS